MSLYNRVYTLTIVEPSNILLTSRNKHHLLHEQDRLSHIPLNNYCNNYSSQSHKSIHLKRLHNHGQNVKFPGQGHIYPHHGPPIWPPDLDRTYSINMYCFGNPSEVLPGNYSDRILSV